MFPFFRPKDLEDLHENLRGKTKRFRLTRGGGALAFTGKLVSLFRQDPDVEIACSPVLGSVDTLAVFTTRSGRFLVFYVVQHPTAEMAALRQAYAHLCPDLSGLRAFLQSMTYGNTHTFLSRVLAEAGGKPDIPSAPPADTETPAPTVPEAPDPSAAKPLSMVTPS